MFHTSADTTTRAQCQTLDLFSEVKLAVVPVSLKMSRALNFTK